MDRINRNLFRFLHPSLQAFLSRIQAGRKATKSKLENLKIAKGLTLVFFSLGLAWVSIEATEKGSIAHYRNQVWPARNLWMSILKEKGLVLRHDLSPYVKLLDSHPHPYSNEISLWASTDRCAVYFTRAPDQLKPELWTCENLSQKLEWKNLGTGFNGIEALAQFFENAPKPAAPRPKTRLIARDPKEFHY